MGTSRLVLCTIQGENAAMTLQGLRQIVGVYNGQARDVELG